MIPKKRKKKRKNKLNEKTNNEKSVKKIKSAKIAKIVKKNFKNPFSNPYIKISKMIKFAKRDFRSETIENLNNLFNANCYRHMTNCFKRLKKNFRTKTKVKKKLINMT